MPVRSFSLGPWDTNCHVIFRNGAAVAVDVGDAPTAVLTFLRDEGLRLEQILITHLHSDHMYGVAALASATGASVLTPAGDAYLRGTGDADGGEEGWPRVAPFASTSLPEQPFTAAGLTVTPLSTPGHTRGGVSFYFPAEKLVCVGDTLFQRNIGRSDFLGGDHNALLRGICEHLFTLPDETLVCTGHGPNTTVGEEKKLNPYFCSHK